MSNPRETAEEEDVMAVISGPFKSHSFVPFLLIRASNIPVHLAASIILRFRRRVIIHVGTVVQPTEMADIRGIRLSGFHQK